MDFAVQGDHRYLSHQETLRLFARACARAGLALRKSKGFNPRPRISLPLPRPVGIASDAERLVLDLTQTIEPQDLMCALTKQMPAGITVRDVRLVKSDERSVPRLVRYRVAFEGVDRSVLAARAQRLMNCPHIHYQRFVHKNGKYVPMDLRPFIDSIELNGQHLFLTLHVTAGGSAKPAEICDVLGLGGANVNHLIQRLEVVWQ